MTPSKVDLTHYTTSLKCMGRIQIIFYLCQRRRVRKAEMEVVDSTDGNDYQDYFEYAMNESGLSPPTNWREGLQLYSSLLDYASNGS